MRCGFVRREDWVTPRPFHGDIGGSPIIQPQTCPGYTTQLPAVVEVATLWAWWEKGQLGMLADTPEMVAELVSIFNGEIVASRSYYMDEMKKK
jgi:hypothetical protein